RSPGGCEAPPASADPNLSPRSDTLLVEVDASRQLDWPDLRNARDLGGLPTADGPTRFGRIVRSDDLNGLTEAGRRAMFDHGITTIVDLRGPVERRLSPPALGDHPGYHHLSFGEENPDSSNAPGAVADTSLLMLDAQRR